MSTIHRRLGGTSLRSIHSLGNYYNGKGNDIFRGVYDANICATQRRHSSGNKVDGKKLIDLRSDTVTKPSKAMLARMSEAEVGDDVYGEDTTVTELERRVASECRMEAGMLVPSGTMGNLIALGVHAPRGTEVLLGNKSHIFYYEGGGGSAYYGVAYHTLQNETDGTLTIASLSDALRPNNVHYPPTSLVCIENTHNMCGGKVLSVEYMKSLHSFCQTNKLPLHVDGARLFNAAVAQNVHISDLLCANSASICFSKGLGCPVGSVLVGSTEFILTARRLRKSLGGGMRQAGGLAAAALYALDNNVLRLTLDHDNAKYLAKELSKFDFVDLVTPMPDSNIVIFGFRDPVNRSKKPINASDVVARLKHEYGVMVNPVAGNRIRAVTHLDVRKEDVTEAITALEAVIKNL
jgi:threonine aldolase